MITGAIFDVDGTLIDSMPMWDDIGSIYLRSKGIEPEADLGRVMFSMTMAEGIAYVKQHYHLKNSFEEITSELGRLIFRFYENELPLKDGVFAFLEALKLRGVKIVAATLSERNMVEAAFSRLKIAPFFDAIFTSTEIGAGKDRPDIFFAAQKHMGTSISETWVFEDGLYAIETAKAAGFQTCGVFDQSSAADQEEIKSVCDVYVTSLSDFPI